MNFIDSVCRHMALIKKGSSDIIDTQHMAILILDNTFQELIRILINRTDLKNDLSTYYIVQKLLVH